MESSESELQRAVGARPYPCSEGDCVKRFARPSEAHRHHLTHQEYRFFTSAFDS